MLCYDVRQHTPTEVAMGIFFRIVKEVLIAAAALVAIIILCVAARSEMLNYYGY